jgi:hypothetical protein
MSNSSQLKYLKHIALSLIFSFLVVAVFFGATQSQDTAINDSIPSKAEALVRGERLFYGLVYRDNKPVNCAGCHNTRFSDTLNWNPDAIEISEKYLDKSVADLSSVLLDPSGEKMAQVHNGVLLTSQDITFIKSYMDHLAGTGLRQSKPVITRLLFFILASILLFLSGTDLIIFKKLKKRWIHFIILLLSFTYITYFLVIGAIDVGHSPGYEPDQPIRFSHKVHAGQNGTDCLYCHSFAPFSKTAGIPPENVCMNCHLLVRSGTRSGAFEIAKIIKHYEELQPLEWVKVYNLPDHVFFSHAQHVGAGAISCQKCHGEVEKLDRIRLNQELTMGWCINCHRTTNINFNENKFYSEYKDLAGKIRSGAKRNVTVENIGGTECMKCHY